MQKKSLLRRNMDLFIGLILIYFSLMGYLYIFQRNFMYFPGGERGDAVNYGIEEPVLAEVKTKDGFNISGWYWPKTQEDAYTLVYFHGNAQAHAPRIQKISNLRRDGHGVLFAEYRGYGGNEGAPSERGMYHDARAYITWLISSYNYDLQDVVLFGESMGTGVAVQMATEFPVRAVILESAYDSTLAVAKNTYWMFPVSLLMKDQFHSIDKVGDLKMPFLMLHASKDAVIPISHAENLFNAIKAPKKFVRIEQGGHNDFLNNGALDHKLRFLSELRLEDREKDSQRNE